MGRKTIVAVLTVLIGVGGVVRYLLFTGNALAAFDESKPEIVSSQRVQLDMWRLPNSQAVCHVIGGGFVGWTKDDTGWMEQRSVWCIGELADSPSRQLIKVHQGQNETEATLSTSAWLHDVDFQGHSFRSDDRFPMQCSPGRYVSWSPDNPIVSNMKVPGHLIETGSIGSYNLSLASGGTLLCASTDGDLSILWSNQEDILLWHRSTVLAHGLTFE